VDCRSPRFAVTVALFLQLLADGQPRIETAYTWATIGETAFEIAFTFDRLSAVMALIVTGVGSLIHIYSTGYMKDDAGYARYFAYLNLFLFFMLLLVLGRSLLVMFVGWEGVGLASYLLIGFWFEDAEKARAGKKAFITNRVGDAGFLIGMFLLYNAFGTLDMDTINGQFLAGPVGVSATLVGVMLFIGATGKSAQIPLHVWLPDAMAGPTPVSALIHAATMVTAGVYMIARLNGIYLHAPEASMLIAWVGAATAFFAATIAVVQTDIKRVLAYSTISQLGFMFIALGVGAYGVAVFHLVTHAFFKACLFLGSGSVIHALSGEQDIRKMGGLAKQNSDHVRHLRDRDRRDRRLAAAVRLLLEGRDPLVRARQRTRRLGLADGAGGADRADHRVLHVPVAGADLPRALAHGARGRAPRARVAAGDDQRADRAGGAVGGRRLHCDPALPPAAAAGSAAGVAMSMWHVPLVGLAIALSVAGLALALFLYRGDARRAEALRVRFAGLHRLLSGKYYIDELYDALIGRPLHWISDHVFLRFSDRAVIDGTLHGLAGLARGSGGVLARVQTGNLHFYVYLVLIGSFAALLWMWAHG
jgi:NADH-quinone oxidoreductase subunit L